VKITFEPISEQEMEVILGEDERLNDLFRDSSTVKYDGYERGKDDLVMYYYGADADKMTVLIFPELKGLPCCDRAVVLKRYGGHGAREETVKLK